MNLQQLSHLVALTETGSFRQAAERVNLSQPALSRSIQALEAELGLQLIDRVGKRNEPTPLGDFVVQRARNALEEVRAIHQAARLEHGHPVSLRLGMGSGPSALLSAGLMLHMLRDHPAVRLKLQRGPTRALLHSLRLRELDAVLAHVRTIDGGADLHLDVLPPLQPAFICRHDHPLRVLQRPVSIREAMLYPLVSTGLSPEMSRLINEALADAASRHEDHLHMECEDIPDLLQVVSRSDAIFLGVGAAVTKFNRERGCRVLAPLELDVPLKLEAAFAYVTVRGKTESEPSRVAREYCRQTLQSSA